MTDAYRSALVVLSYLFVFIMAVHFKRLIPPLKERSVTDVNNEVNKRSCKSHASRFPQTFDTHYFM